MSSDLQQHVIKFHANRAKALLYAGGAGAFVVIDWLFYFVWPTPEVTTQPWLYQEPFKTGFFIILLLVMGAALVAGLYRTVTPRPLVQLDSEGMVYELYPFLRRSVSWADVWRISAVKGSYSVSALQRSARLTLSFDIKPPCRPGRWRQVHAQVDDRAVATAHLARRTRALHAALPPRGDAHRSAEPTPSRSQ